MSFPAEEFASRLERHAKKLQEQRERKEKEDDWKPQGLVCNGVGVVPGRVESLWITGERIV